MDLSSVDAVLRKVRKNKFRVWAGDRPDSAVSRMKSEAFVRIHHVPKFQIGAGAGIFTIGSCFARNVESCLVRKGFNVLTAGLRLPKDLYFDNPALTKNDETTHSGVLNKYSIASIRSELERGARHEVETSGEFFIEVEPGLYFDAQASSIKPNSLDVLNSVRAEINRVNARLSEADAVLFTLGTTETWFDIVTGLPFNFKPWPNLMKSKPERFGFANMDVTEAVDQLEKVVQLVRSVARPGVKVVLTVSPVPMGSTWTDMDVLTANSHSKCTLRAAAGAVAGRYDWVDYYPSYEIVHGSARDTSWSADNLHVSNEMAEFVVQYFAELYAS